MAKKRRKVRAASGASAAFTHVYGKPGAPPGTVEVLDWDTSGPAPTLTVVDFTPGTHEEQQGVDLASCRRAIDDPSVSWVHVQGQISAANLQKLGAEFGLHPLALEDVLHLGQRPKLDTFEIEAPNAIVVEPGSEDGPGAAPRRSRELFAVLAIPRFVDEHLVVEQVSLFLGSHYVISFHEGSDDVFAPIRTRVRADRSRFRTRNADYLFYALVDLVVDLGFPVLEALGERLDAIEEALTVDARSGTLEQIQRIKRELVLLRRFLWAQREVVAALHRDEHEFFRPETKIYLRDGYDHAVQLLDLVETYREMAGNLLDVYLSAVSNRLNEAMRFLTVIGTIFLPLSFFVGVYGMNFKHMPELEWSWGYPAAWAIIVVTAFGMLWYFRRRRWL
jgi:magnesium transporter